MDSFFAKARDKMKELTSRKNDRRGSAPTTASDADSSALAGSSSDPSFSRFRDLRRAVNAPVVDIDALRQVGWFGCPDDSRAAAWCLLLEYWPTTKATRESVVTRKRAEYQEVLARHYFNRDWNTALDATNASFGSDAQIGTEEIATMRQIRKDVPRTANTVAAVSNEKTQLMLERILFVWAIRHPASGYVQGMNDLALPFLYTVLADLTTSREADFSDTVGQSVKKMLSWTAEETARRFEELGQATLMDLEADVYWLTATFIGRVQDNFTYNQSGTHAMVAQLQRVLTTTDPQLTLHLDELGIKFPEFAFRWMNCFLLREFTPMQSIRLFDTYLCELHEFAGLHIYVCAAMLRLWTSTIVASSDFVFVMHFLQSPPTREIDLRGMDELCSSAYLLQQLYTSNLTPPVE